MAVHINKILLSFAFILIMQSSISFAEEPYKYKAQTLSAVQKKFEIALIELEEAISKCNEEKKMSNLSASHLKKINISYKEMMTILFYFSAKADLECVTKLKYKNLSYALLKYQRTLQSHNKDLDPLPYTYFDAGHEEQFEIRYNEIPSKYRAILEEIPELSRPFDDSKILREVEIEIYDMKPKDIYY